MYFHFESTTVAHFPRLALLTLPRDCLSHSHDLEFFLTIFNNFCLYCVTSLKTLCFNCINSDTFQKEPRVGSFCGAPKWYWMPLSSYWSSVTKTTKVSIGPCGVSANSAWSYAKLCTSVRWFALTAPWRSDRSHGGSEETGSGHRVKCLGPVLMTLGSEPSSESLRVLFMSFCSSHIF